MTALRDAGLHVDHTETFRSTESSRVEGLYLAIRGRSDH